MKKKSEKVMSVVKAKVEKKPGRPAKAIRDLKKDIKAGKKEIKVEKVMHEYKEGKLRSGSKKGPVVSKRKQALAIALNEARKEAKKSSKPMAKKRK